MYMTPWVQRLLGANIVVHLLATGSPFVRFNFGFIPGQVFERPWTLVTYMFLHADWWHLGVNMFMLFIFGPRLEGRLGGRGFMMLYILAGIGGALLTFMFDRNVLMVGASGAVLGVVAGYATLWPRDQILIWGVLPVESWLLAMFFVGASLWSGITGGGGNIAHFAHLGGLAFGYGYVRWIGLRSEIRKKRWREGKGPGASKAPLPGRVGRREVQPRWRAIDTDTLHELNRAEVTTLFEKIKTEGEGSLTDDERAFLDRMAP